MIGDVIRRAELRQGTDNTFPRLIFLNLPFANYRRKQYDSYVVFKEVPNILYSCENISDSKLLPSSSLSFHYDSICVVLIIHPEGTLSIHLIARTLRKREGCNRFS
jgi:hypothetical protein